MSLPVYIERQIQRKAISIKRCSALGVQSEDLEKCIFKSHYGSSKKWESWSKLNSNLSICLWNVLFNNIWIDKHIFTSFFSPHRLSPCGIWKPFQFMDYLSPKLGRKFDILFKTEWRKTGTPCPAETDRGSLEQPWHISLLPQVTAQ